MKPLRCECGHGVSIHWMDAGKCFARGCPCEQVHIVAEAEPKQGTPAQEDQTPPPPFSLTSEGT